jgi:hypothetical protein
MRPLDLFVAMDVDKDKLISHTELEQGLRRAGCTNENSLQLTDEEVRSLSTHV